MTVAVSRNNPLRLSEFSDLLSVRRVMEIGYGENRCTAIQSVGAMHFYPECLMQTPAATSLAAFDIATAEVIGQLRRRHRRSDFLSFPHTIDAFIPGDPASSRQEQTLSETS